LRSSEINHLLNNVEDYGFKISGLEFDFKKIVERSRKVSKQLSSGIAHLLKKNKVTVIDGYARFNKNKNLEVKKDGKSLGEFSAKNIIIATGARARQLEGLEADGELIWSYKEAMTPKALPKSLLVVGSGAIGIEFASFYKNLGSEVTVVEIMDRVMPVEDHEISELARKSFEKQGMKIITEAKVNKIEKGNNKVAAHIEIKGKTQTQEFERVIMAVGIVGNSDDIGLEHLPKVEIDRGHIKVDQWLQTGEQGIYAIGDVVSPPWLAHKASHEGIICVEKIAKLNNVHPLDVSNIPGCTYCMPQVASVGLTEKAAIDKGYEIKVGRFPFVGNGKAIALGEPEGLVKTIFDKKTGELLGAHMIGAEVTELIQGFGIAKTLETTEIELMHTVFPHPTLSEMMHESVLDAYDKVIHF
jgi:dihydrolipoamide dehydrogenase